MCSSVGALAPTQTFEFLHYLFIFQRNFFRFYKILDKECSHSIDLPPLIFSSGYVAIGFT
jgi:hypothetical protein